MKKRKIMNVVLAWLLAITMVSVPALAAETDELISGGAGNAVQNEGSADALSESVLEEADALHQTGESDLPMQKEENHSAEEGETSSLLPEEESSLLIGEEDAGDENELSENPQSVREAGASAVCVNPHLAPFMTEEEIEAAKERALSQVPDASGDDLGDGASGEAPDVGLHYGNGYYDNWDEAAAFVRSKMKARVTDVVFGIESSDYYDSQIFYDFMDKVEAHTGIPTEGDYIAYQYESWSASSWYDYTENGRFFVIEFTYVYYTTAAMEAQMNQVVSLLLSQLNLDGKTDYQKVKAIYDYIADNVEYYYGDYDYGYYENLQYTAYAALIHRVAVCQGYANLLYRLLLEVGVDCRIIAGNAGGPHAWNIVRLDGLYYNVDVTWDAGYSTYSYFLVTMAEFTDHVRDQEYRTASFNSKYPMATRNYANTSHGASHITMHRLYNPNSGEHFYTANSGEKVKLLALGWKDEGVGWYAPTGGSKVVYRLYNPRRGFEEHHYTSDQNEIRVLKSQSWNLEGPAWASDDKKGVAVYRLFNPASPNSASSHHYTTDLNERNVLTAYYGWRYEGINWYGVKVS